MNLVELFENATIDVRESMWAEITRRALIARVENDPRFRGQIVGLKTGNALVDHIIAFATFRFVSGQNGGEYQHNLRGLGGTIVCEVPGEVNRETVLAQLRSRGGASTFRHEFQHFLDYTLEGDNPSRGDYDLARMQAGDKTHVRSYVNSDAEFSAFLKELAEPLLRILRAAQEGNVEVLARAHIEPDFRKYIRTQHFLDSAELWGVLDAMNSNYRVRLLKRLAALHKAATALSGVAQPFDPDWRDKVIMWLGQMLKRLGVGRDRAWGKRN